MAKRGSEAGEPSTMRVFPSAGHRLGAGMMRGVYLCKLHRLGFRKRAFHTLVGPLVVAYLVGWLNRGEKH